MCNAEPQAKIKHKSTTQPKETEASSADQNVSKENINDKSAVRKGVKNVFGHFNS